MRTHTRRERRNGPGVQHMWGFDNGRLVSVVPDRQTQNLWQLTVHDGSGRQGSGAIVARVLDGLRPVDVRLILRRIEAQR